MHVQIIFLNVSLSATDCHFSIFFIVFLLHFFMLHISKSSWPALTDALVENVARALVWSAEIGQYRSLRFRFRSIGVIDILVRMGYICCGVGGCSMLGGPIGISSDIPRP